MTFKITKTVNHFDIMIYKKSGFPNILTSTYLDFMKSIRYVSGEI